MECQVACAENYTYSEQILSTPCWEILDFPLASLFVESNAQEYAINFVTIDIIQI